MVVVVCQACEGDAELAVQVDLLDVDAAQRPADVALVPARPPLQVLYSRGTEAG